MDLKNATLEFPSQVPPCIAPGPIVTEGAAELLRASNAIALANGKIRVITTIVGWCVRQDIQRHEG